VTGLTFLSPTCVRLCAKVEVGAQVPHGKMAGMKRVLKAELDEGIQCMKRVESYQKKKNSRHPGSITGLH